jgi:hypothetical protein
MNIIYDLIPETGMMRLKFKDDILDHFVDDETKLILNKYILPILAMNDKFVLTGSLSLKLLGFEPIGKVGDIDIGLSASLTEEEWTTLKNFFGLVSSKSEMYNNDSKQTIKFDPNARIWQFYKEWNEPAGGELMVQVSFKMDIFNDETLRKKDIIEVYLGDFPIKLIHPSITYSYRMRYALDVRSSVAFKYWERMESFMNNAKEYYLKIRVLYKMIARVYEHNTAMEGDKEKINRIRELVDRREQFADNFFDKIFKETIDPFNLLVNDLN